MTHCGSVAWYRRTIDAAIEAQVDAAARAHGARLSDAVRHAACGGKRVRGTLLLDVARSVAARSGAALEAHDAGTSAAAVAIELLHAASLVLDDMRCFDGATSRRGHPATHVAFGERLALMAAVALFAMASLNLAAMPTAAGAPAHRAVHAEMMAAVAAAARGQLEEAESGVHSADANALKTGALFAVATAAGAVLAGADAARVAAARAAGAAFGALFQAADDATDVIEDAAATANVAAAVAVAAAADDALVASLLLAGCASSTIEHLRSDALVAIRRAQHDIG